MDPATRFHCNPFDSFPRSCPLEPSPGETKAIPTFVFNLHPPCSPFPTLLPSPEPHTRIVTFPLSELSVLTLPPVFVGSDTPLFFRLHAWRSCTDSARLPIGVSPMSKIFSYCLLRLCTLVQVTTPFRIVFPWSVSSQIVGPGANSSRSSVLTTKFW